MLRTEAATLARKLMNLHNLHDWTFEYDRAKRRFGYCRYRAKTISLSEHLVALNDVDKVTDVILHEIAHALVGPGHHHNDVWKAMARRIGARPERCYDETVKRPQHNYEGVCPGCGEVTATRMRLKWQAQELARGPCCKRHNGGKWDKRFILRWRKVNRTELHSDVEFVEALP